MDSLQDLATQFLQSAEGSRAVSDFADTMGEGSRVAVLRVGFLLLPVVVALAISAAWFVARRRAAT